jgi:hypothetical protein
LTQPARPKNSTAPCFCDDVRALSAARITIDRRVP